MEESRYELFAGLMGQAAKSIQRIKGEKMRAYRLSAAHTTCLCHLDQAQEEGLTQSQLIALEGTDRAQVSRVLGELRQRGYVAVLGQEGRYKNRYVLTDSGKEIALEIRDIILDINRFVSDSIPEQDIQIFYRTLRTITQNLERAAKTYCSGKTKKTRT